jgi:hypothetical protein
MDQRGIADAVRRDGRGDGEMRVAILAALLVLVALTAAQAERVEVVWEQRFDVTELPAGKWEIQGTAALREGALVTRTDPKAEISGVVSQQAEPIPTAEAGYWLRLEWAVTPVKMGAYGQAAAIVDGPCVVVFGEGKAGLNLGYPGKTAVKVGEQATVSCDFVQDAVLSWKVNGEEQLSGPVPAWKLGATQAKVALGEPGGGGEAESRYAWVRLSRVYSDAPSRLQFSRWEDPKRVESGQAAAFLVGQASAMDKVFREAGDFGGSFDPHVRIAAAGRERESFQLVVIPVANPLRQGKVKVADLLHEDGVTLLPSSHVSWYRVGYVQTQQSNSAIRRAGWWWPDVLLPAGPFDVEPGFVQPVWFTVDVPEGTKAGVYRGLITVQAEGGAEVTVGLELTVRPFSLPVRGKLKTAFAFAPTTWEAWYRPDEVRGLMGLTAEEKTGELPALQKTERVLPHEKWLEVYDFLLAHRLSPTMIYSGLRDGTARTVPGREDMQYCYDRGMNATCLVNVDKLPEDPAVADKYMEELESYLADWNRFIAEKNWPDFTWYVHGFDESDMREAKAGPFEPSIKRIYGRIGEKFPRVKRESANPVNPAHVGLFDIWTPVTAQWQPEMKERQAAGDEVWAYVCCWPTKPYANFFTDFPGVDPRVLPWQYYQHGITGFLYYLTNYYESQENRNVAGPKWPERPWNTLSFGCNNDGVLIYPGPEATPLASTRLENLRDGIEDYEALAMLRELTERVQAAGGHEELVNRAREALAVRPSVSKSWTEYTQEPGELVRARAEVDGLIGEMLQAKGGAASRLGLHPDASAVTEDEALGEREAGSGTLGRDLAEALEGEEDVCLLFEGDADTVVPHVELLLASAFVTAEEDAGADLISHELDGVRDQIAEHLIEGDGVGKHGGQQARDLEVYAARAEWFLQVGADALDHFPGAGGLELQGPVAVTVEFEEGGDEALQVLGGTLNSRHAVAAALIQRLGMLSFQLRGETLNGHERGLEIVGCDLEQTEHLLVRGAKGGEFPFQVLRGSGVLRALGSAGGADDEASRDIHLPSRRVGGLPHNGAGGKVGGHAGHRADRLPNHGQRQDAACTLLHVVEGDHGEVIRNGQAEFGGGLHEPIGEGVRDAEHRGRRSRPNPQSHERGPQLVQGRERRGEAHDQAGVGREAGGGEAVAVALELEGEVQVALRPGEEGDSPVA